jgi:hypothetical protein
MIVKTRWYLRLPFFGVFVEINENSRGKFEVKFSVYFSNIVDFAFGKGTFVSGETSPPA